MTLIKFTPLITLPLLFTACTTIGPDYERPEVHTPPTYKSADASERIGKSTTQLNTWWYLFDDPTLTALIEASMQSSPDIEAAQARIDQAMALAQVTHTDLFPTVDFTADAERRRRSQANGQGNQGIRTRNQITTTFDLDYEIDLWGRLKRLNTSALARAQAEQFAYDYTLLTLQADIAETYFRLRALAQEIEVIEKTIQGRKEALDILKQRFDTGLSNELEVAQADTEWAIAFSSLQSTKRSYAQNENALAVLVGQSASSFRLEASNATQTIPPEIPLYLPSELLLRRPDIAEAERLMAAAHEQIGAETAAYYPSISLVGRIGYESSSASNLLTANANLAELGPSLTLPIFNRKKISYNVAQAEAEYRELFALYKKQLLTAFEAVENGLSDMHFLKAQLNAQQQAANSANRAAAISRERYESGLVNYFEVVETERVELIAKQELSRLSGEQLISIVQLIKALGGGWHSAPEPMN